MRLYFLTTFLFFACFKLAAHSPGLREFAPGGPLTHKTQNPLYLLFLDESLERGAVDLKTNQWHLSLETTFSNILEFGNVWIGPGRSSEKIIIDCELWRTVIKADYGATDRLKLSFEVPIYSFSAGFLDGFVSDFHKFFGFPNGGRDLYENFRLKYDVKKGNLRYKPQPTSFGLGDMIFSAKFMFLRESTWLPAASFKTSFKFPTGNPALATGSGYPDLAFSAYIEKSIDRFHSYTHFGVILLGGMDVLQPILGLGQMSFGQSFEINLWKHYISLVIQVKGNTPFLKDIKIEDVVNFPVFDLGVGLSGNVQLENTDIIFHYEFAFIEDVLSRGPSVDFSVFFKAGVTI